MLPWLWLPSTPMGRVMAEDDLTGASLDEWAAAFHKKNKEDCVGKDSSQAWLEFVENATTRIAEFVRREEHASALEAVSIAFGRLCCFVQEYATARQREKFTLRQLSEIVWNKYPGVCYFCTYRFGADELKSPDCLQCRCLGVPRRSQDQANTAMRNLEIARGSKKRPVTLDEWGHMIREIYGNVHKELPLAAVCLHFLEEVGEVAEALREIEQLELLSSVDELPGKIRALEEELADVFSWTFGLLNKLDQTLEKARAYYRGYALPPVRPTVVIGRALSAPIFRTSVARQ